MDLAITPRATELREALLSFMDSHVYPAEPVYWAQLESSANRFAAPAVVGELQSEARGRGLWNLFLRDTRLGGAGLTNVEYAYLAEVMGRSKWLAPIATNCAAPDTGNMELLAEYGSDEQRDRWLQPLLEARIRSCFSMTEPDVASSDPRNLTTRITPDGESYVVNGRKWWSTGALSPDCAFAVVMGVTDPDGPPQRRHSMILVPMDTPGVQVVRPTRVLGYDDGGHGGHAEIAFADVRLPAASLIGGAGDGFSIAQARLGPGRIHHGMRLIGVAERAFELLCRRAHERTPFGRPLADQGLIQDWVAESRIAIEQARLLLLKAAWLMDTAGNRAAHVEISAIKVVVPRMTAEIVDRAIQVYGAKGLSDDTPLAALYAYARSLRIADGPDEVHKHRLARRELARFKPRA